MKKITLFLVLTLIVFTAKSQFEQKFTMQLSAGYSILQGELTQSYNNGFTIDGGLQYNFNRNFSLITLIKYGTYFLNEILGLEGKYNNLGISICPKYIFLKGSSFKPYIYGGVNINFIKYSYTDPGGISVEFKGPLCLGYLGGLGAEFKISEKISLFSQLGYNHINFNDKEMNYQTDINSIFIQFGVNINMFKSKSL